MSSMIIVVCYRASVDSLGLGVPYGVYIGNGFKLKRVGAREKPYRVVGPNLTLEERLPPN
jgi:hypothetical protein